MSRRVIGFVCIAASSLLLASCGGNGGNKVPTTTSAAPGVGAGPGWQAVLADYYGHGRLDHPHSCAAVREAIRHVAVTGPIYSNISPALKAYARGVCR